MSGVTMARWLMPRHRVVSCSLMPASVRPTERSFRRRIHLRGGLDAECGLDAAKRPISVGGLEDGPGVGLAHRLGVGPDAGVALGQPGDRVEILVVDPALGQPRREAETGNERLDRTGRVVAVTQRL